MVRSAEMKQKIDFLKNFGFAGETTVLAPGINSKMDEVRAAYGLLNLKQVDKAIEARKVISDMYREGLKDVRGIRLLDEPQGVRNNYSYFPIFIDENEFGMSRDALYFRLQEDNIFGRRYFYPLISTFSMYRDLDSARPENIPVATKIAEQVLCLPIYYGLENQEVERIIEIIKKK